MGGATISTNVAVSGARIVRELDAQSVPATPQIYEVWHAHLSGVNVALSRAIHERIASHQNVTAEFLSQLHDTFFGNVQNQQVVEKTSRAVMMEIDGIVELVRVSLGASNRYGQTLSGLLADIVTTNDATALKHIVHGLVRATEEIKANSETLETRLQASSREIDELRRVLETTRLETLQDALTGISNRKHFEQALIQAIDTSQQTRKPFCLLMLDIDFFKHFNDKHGHLLGDKVLKVVAQSLRDKCPESATVARYGGEEFAVIVEGADMMAGWIAAEAARQTILSRELVKRSTGEKLGRITVSIGVAAWTRLDTRQSLVGRADAALLQAKKLGRNRTVTEDQVSATAVA